MKIVSKMKTNINDLKFLDYIKDNWSSICPDCKYKDYWHFDYLAEQLREFVDYYLGQSAKKKSDFMVNIPPVTFGSTLTSYFLPSFIWLKNPKAKIYLFSEASVVTDHFITQSVLPFIMNGGEVERALETKSFNNNQGGIIYNANRHLLTVEPDFIIIDGSLNEGQIDRILMRTQEKDFVPIIHIGHKSLRSDLSSYLSNQKERESWYYKLPVVLSANDEVFSTYPLSLEAFYSNNNLLDSSLFDYERLLKIHRNIGKEEFAKTYLQSHE